MNKGEFIQEIAQRTDVPKTIVAKVVDSLGGTIIDVLKKDGVVDVGIGRFKTDKRAARKGRNPQNGQIINIKAKRVAKFKPGKKLKDAVQ